MPIYEYQCESCTDRFEIKQSMKDDPLTSCPRCGKSVQRLISSPAIMFKGSGWYVTDYSDKMKPSPDSDAPTTQTEEKKDTQPPTSEATTSTAPSTPAPASAPSPASTPSSTASQATTTAPRLPPRSSSRRRSVLVLACGLGWSLLLHRGFLRSLMLRNLLSAAFINGLTAVLFGVATFADFANRSCAAARPFCKLAIMVDLS